MSTCALLMSSVALVADHSAGGERLPRIHINDNRTAAGQLQRRGADARVARRRRTVATGGSGRPSADRRSLWRGHWSPSGACAARPRHRGQQDRGQRAQRSHRAASRSRILCARRLGLSGAGCAACNRSRNSLRGRPRRHLPLLGDQHRSTTAVPRRARYAAVGRLHRRSGWNARSQAIA